MFEVAVSSCEFYIDGHPCGRPSVERLVYCNANMCSHVHPEGAINTCKAHLDEFRHDHLLTTTAKLAFE